MSYLTLEKGILPDFSKAVISLWFRAPRKSVITASQSGGLGDGDFTYLNHVLPLVTFGKIQQNKNPQLVFKANILVGWPPNPATGVAPKFGAYTGYAAGTPYEVDPCYIGLVCNEDGTFDIAVNIQMGTYGSYTDLQWFATAINYVAVVPPGGMAPGGGYILGSDGGPGGKADIKSSTEIADDQPEVFYVETDIGLEPDKWHHLLLSFDVGGDLSIGSPWANSDCKLWYAIDDKDYRGPENLRPYRDPPFDAGSRPPGPNFHPEGDEGTLGSNGILTENMHRQSGDFTDKYFMNHPIADPAGSYSPEPITTKDEPFGIPGSSHYEEGILRVELAEFQMFTDVTLDTEKVSNRRAFIDFEKDQDGNDTNRMKPVNPMTAPITDDNPDGVPPAVKLLEKRPEILLHGSNNWKAGYNTGTTGVETDEDGNIVKIPEGQFKPVAGIEKYSPDPSLTKTST